MGNSYVTTERQRRRQRLKRQAKQTYNEILDKMKMSKKKLFIILGVATAVILFISIYFGLMPFSFHFSGFRVVLAVLLIIWSIPLLFYSRLFNTQKSWKRSWFVAPLVALVVLIVVCLLTSIITSPLFMSGRYREMISVVDNHEFTEDVEDYTTMQIPVVDKTLAEKLGDKKLGEDNLGSQFGVGEYYMICHNNNLYWIAPIEFNGFFPWANRGVSPGYVMINANNPADVQVIKSELRYTDSAYFWRDLDRNNYFGNLTAWRANDAHLELTDEGEPRFVETVYANKIGFLSGRDVVGIIVTNPYTGECEYYDYLSAPTWINHVITEEIVIEQLNNWGSYVNGFFNAIFAKNEVLNVSTGVNYVYSNGNMYLQTGMTSVGSDESIVGVMMVDMRTKEAFFYRIGGATEYAAAQSAIGKDQEKRYTASDPIMINLNDTPTYFIMLKDDEGLVKRYAYVNVKDYRLVATGETKEEALLEYNKLIDNDEETLAEERTISEIVPVNVDGNTYYYIKLEKEQGDAEGFENFVFRVSIKTNSQLPFLKTGDRIKVTYYAYGDLYEITELETI